MSTKSDKPKRKKSREPSPTYIQLLGQRHEAKYWTDCLRIFLDKAYEDDPDKFNSELVSTPYKGSRRNIGIYQDSEEEEMQRLPGTKPTPIANSSFYAYTHLSSYQIKKRCREVRERLGWREDSVQIFMGDQLLYPDG